MNTTILLLTVFAQSAATLPDTDLFTTLDRDGNGTVTSDEISESQRPHFQRALRVSDRNEDGSLTREEFAAAVTEPERVVVSQRSGRQLANMDFKRFDRNDDGNITKDELPPQLQQRFQRIVDRSGQSSIPVERLQQIARGERPKSSDGDKSIMKDKMEMQPTAAGGGRMVAAVKRLDVNRDGKLSRKELTKAPRLAQMLDRNRDGEVSAAELAIASRNNPKTQPRRGTSEGNKGKRPQSSSGRKGPGSKDANSFFDRLDADNDGKLTRDELPQRLRPNLQRVDKDGDGSVSKQEFSAAMRQRQKKSPSTKK